MFLKHYIRRTRRNLAAMWLLGAALVIPLDGQQSLASDVADFDPVCNVRGSSAKLAFLIGNSDYGIDSGRDALANPAKDIASLCSSFADLDYSVIGVSDVKSSASQSILSLLQREAANVDTVVIYYAGHGFEYSGANFLVPVDAPTYSSKALLQTDFMPLDQLLQAVGSVSEFTLVFLDACRTRDHVVTIPDEGGPDGAITALGFQQFEFDNQAVIFASQKGAVAYDSLSPSGPDTSPFAAAISQALLVPGLPLNEYFGNVTEYVRQNTKSFSSGQQKPFYYSGFGNVKHYLHEPKSLDTGNAVEAQLITEDQISNLFPASKVALEDGSALLTKALSKYDSVRWLATAATGSAFAQYVVGGMYHYGIGVEVDFEQAEKWLRMSAAQDYATGLTALAYFLQKSDADDAQGLLHAEINQLYEKASAMNYPKAQSHLGFALWNGTLGITDKDRAKSLFTAASENGHAYATFADAYYGDNRAFAMARLRSFAAAGREDGNNWICELFYLENRVEDAVDDCRIAAEAGFAGARAIYAEAYRYAWGVEANSKEARFWGRLALSQFDLAPNKRLRLESFISAR